jgi:tetratricopeptide (TPR) repeat protein
LASKTQFAETPLLIDSNTKLRTQDNRTSKRGRLSDYGSLRKLVRRFKEAAGDGFTEDSPVSSIRRLRLAVIRSVTNAGLSSAAIQCRYHALSFLRYLTPVSLACGGIRDFQFFAVTPPFPRDSALVQTRLPRSEQRGVSVHKSSFCLISLLAGLLSASPCLLGCAWLGKTSGNPSLECQNLLEQAQRAEETGEIEQAGIFLQQAIQANPENAEARRELAQLLLKHGDVDAAVDQLRIAVVQNPDDVDSFIQLARIQLDHGRHDGAEQAANNALRLDASHVGALLLKAELAEVQGREALELETYHRVLAREPENNVARQRVAEIQIAAGRPERAAPLLRAACESKTVSAEQHAAARWTLGIAYGQQQRWRDSVTALAAAATYRREMTADDWYRLAYARYATNDISGALSDAAMAMRLHPNHRQAVAMTGALQQTFAEQVPNLMRLRRVAMAVPTPAGW